MFILRNLLGIWRIFQRISTVQEDIEQSNRRDLGALTFDTLDLTQGERDGVYEAVVNLVESRLWKARSLKGK